MSEWKEYKLEEIVTFQRGHDLPKSKMMEGEYPVAGSNGIIGYHNNFTTKGPGVTIGRSGNIGGQNYYESDYWAHNTVLYVKVFKKVEPRFFYYFLKTLDLSQFNAGSAVPTLNRNHIHELSITIPDIPGQRAIASILSSLDEKIDLLNRQNKTLEQLAETLFRQWFIEEADPLWKPRALGELVSVKRGGSPRPIQDYLSDTGLRWLKISDATKDTSPYIFEIKEHIKEEGLNKTTFLKKGSLVLSNSATPGIPKILQVDSCIHDGWLHFPKSHFSNEFLYLLFKKIREELIQQGNGSIFTNLKTDILKEYSIPIADDNSLKFFDAQVKHLFEKILKNQIQIRSLTQIRDTLLPKLMSGEVRVKNTRGMNELF